MAARDWPYGGTNPRLVAATPGRLMLERYLRVEGHTVTGRPFMLWYVWREVALAAAQAQGAMRMVEGSDD